MGIFDIFSFMLGGIAVPGTSTVWDGLNVVYIMEYTKTGS